MKKILHVTQCLSGGGAGRELIYLARYSMDVQEFDHRIVSLCPSIAGGRQLAEVYKVPVIDEPSRGQLEEEIDNADITQISWWNNPEITAFLHGYIPETRLIIRYHVAGHTAPQCIVKEYLDMADVNVISYKQLPLLNHYDESWKKKRVERILHGTDLMRLQRTTAQPHPTFNVGYIGTVSFVKMHPDYVSMSNKINIPNVKFVVCGNIEEQSLLRQVDQLSAQEKFDFKGYVENIGNVISEMDVFGYPLCPETYASTDLVLQEVMYAGVPAVVFNYGGLTQTVKDGHNGIVVNSPEEYQEAIEYLYHNPAERDRMGKNARAFVEKNLGIKNTINKYHSVYKRLLNQDKTWHEWGKDSHKPLLKQPITYQDIIGEPPKQKTADIFIASMGQYGDCFAKSMNVNLSDKTLFEVDKEISQVSDIIYRIGLSWYLAYDPKDDYLNFWIGLVLNARQKTMQALECWTKAHANGFDHWRLYWYMAVALTECGKQSDAAKVYEYLSQLEPDWKEITGQFNVEQNAALTSHDNRLSPESIYQDIISSLKNDQPLATIEKLEALLASYPDFALAHNDLGVLYHQHTDRAKAQYHYERAVELDPNYLTFQKNLADFYYVELGQVEDALQIYVKILNTKPEDTETLLILGHICTALEKFDDAKIFYNRILSLEPENRKARELLKKLEKHQLSLINGPSDQRDIKAGFSGYLVSAIVSTYNSERFIRGCLEDLERQTIADRLEIIVVNSGSQQNEEKIIKEFQEKYSNIKYIKTDRRETVYAAWNRGIKASSGKYITNANTDDRHRKDAFEVMANTLEANPDIALVYADLIITETENEWFETATPVGFFKWLDYNRDDLLNKGCFMGPQPMWRRQVHTEYGYFDASYVTSGDYEFWLRISQTHPFLHIPVQLGLYLRSPGSIEHSNRQTQWEENQKILNMYRKVKAAGSIIRRIQSSPSPMTHAAAGNNPTSAESIYRSLQTEMGKKVPEEVISELVALVATYPEFALAYNDLGVLYYQAGNKEKAHQNYEKAVRLDPANKVFQKNLADFYYVEFGRVEDALQIYLKILEADPTDVETLLITGHICVSLQRFEDARMFYGRVLELEPANAAARHNLEKLDQMNAAPSEIRTPEEMYNQIQPQLNNGDPHKAIASLEKLLAQFPDFATAHNDLGVLYYHTGDSQKAQDHYERAVELMPDNINFQKNLADFYCIELGRIEDALKIYVSILATNPQDVETLMATGQICVALEKPDEARDFFNQALQIEPWNADVRNQIEALERQPSEAFLNSESAEDAYRRLQEKLNTLTPAEAIVELEKLVESHPNFAIGHNDLGVLHYNTGNKEKALYHYQQAARLQPEIMAVQKNLADFLFVEQGQVEEALERYMDILATHPDDVETLLISGHICVALQEFEKAKDFYHRVLAIEPDNKDANKNLQALTNRQNGYSSAKADCLKDVTERSAKAEEIDLDNKKSENQDIEHQPTVSIIISLDGIQNRIKQCIDSLTSKTQDALEILLIDTGATQGTLKWAQNLESEQPQFRLVKCDKMHGWAQCLNQAVRAAAGAYVVWLHNDVIVADGWFKGMLQCFQGRSEIGVVGPMSNAASGIQTVDLAVDRDPERLDADAKAFYTQNQYRRISTTRLASFCLMFRRALFDRIGDFDSQLISEQAVVTDFCKRSAAWGFQNLVAGDVLVYHADRHKGNRNLSGTGLNSAEDKKRLNENWGKMAGDQRFSKNIQKIALLKTVDALRQKGYTDKAVDTVLNAIGAIPTEKRLYLALAEICLSLKRYQDAIEALGEMPAESNMDPDSEANEDLDDASFDSVLPFGFENQALKTSEILGYAEEGLKNFSAAESHAEQILSIEPQSVRALNLKGILAYRQNDQKAAEKFFEQAIASDPSDGEPYSNLATVKLAAGEEEEALRLLEKGFILSPTDLDIATNYHAMVAARREYKRAEGVAREAVAIYPNNQKISYMLIDVLLQQGKQDEAMDRIEAAIVRFGIEDGILAAALQVRKKLGCMTIRPSKKKPTVSCCMIIKDEEKYLARCLASVKPIVDEMIVVDTGSTDRSKDIATALGAKVYDYEWQDDFATARNYSLKKASGDWILILDGDEVISPLDYKNFNRIVKNRPKAPVAYTIVTRNYSALANIVGWVPNDGKYAHEEAAAGWIPSVKTRLFYGKDHIWFEGAVHELVDPVVKRKGFETKQCHIPVHHYGRLDKQRLTRKGKVYFEIGKKKMEEMGDDVSAVREMAIQATTLEKNEIALELWQKLISLEPSKPMVADAYINMATLYNRLGDFDQALMVAKKAVSTVPNVKESLYNYALAELHVGNAQTAIEVLKKLIRQMPDYPPAQFILAAAYFSVGEKEKGFKIIQALKATPLGPNLVYPIFELAETLLKAQMNEYALRLLGAAIDCDTVNQQILELFNECIQKKGATRNSTDASRQPAPERQPIAFQNLPL